MPIYKNTLDTKVDELMSELRNQLVESISKIDGDFRDIELRNIDLKVKRSIDGVVFDDYIKLKSDKLKLSNRKRYIFSKLDRKVSDSVFYKEYIGKKVFLLNKNGNVECSILTDKNIGGFGLGLYGYFYTSKKSFTDSFRDFNDNGMRTFFLECDICDYMNISRDELVEKVNESREYFASRNYEAEKELGLFVEL